MSLRKSPSKLTAPNSRSTEELLKDLESEEDVSWLDDISEDDYKNDIISFISAYNLQQGPHKINKTVLKYLYQQWSSKPLALGSFYNEMAKFFETQGNGDKSYYFVNHDAITLSKRAYELVKKRTRKPTSSPKIKQHFDAFLNKHNIKAGNVWIKSYVLYYIYDKWTYTNRKSKPLGYKSFLAMCTLYFPKRRTAGVHIFRVDPSIYKVVSKRKIKHLEEAKENYVKRRRKVKKEGKKADVETSQS